MPSITDVAEDWVLVLERVTQRAKDTSANFDKRRLDWARERALDYCLKRAIDICDCCILAAKAGLPESLWVLDRSLFESLLWTRWISLSDANAQDYSEIGKNELKRAMKKNLEAGTFNAFNTADSSNQSQAVLSRMLLEKIPKPKKFERLAQDTGLASLYTTTYGVSSLYAHGEAFGIQDSGPRKDEVYASTAMAIGFIQCIELMAKDWILANQISSQDTIDRVIGTSDKRSAAKSAAAADLPISASPTLPRRHRRRHGPLK